MPGNTQHDRKQGRLDKVNGVERNVPEEEEKGYSVQFVSRTTDPYTEEEISRFMDQYGIGEKFLVDPRRLRTMHAGISERFSSGRKISDTVKEIQSAENLPKFINKLPIVHLAIVEIPVRPWDVGNGALPKGGKVVALFTEDHRRVVAARMAGVSLWAQFLSDPSVVGNYTTQDIGTSIEVRRYPLDKGAHQRVNKTTFPSSGSVYRPS